MKLISCTVGEISKEKNEIRQNSTKFKPLSQQKIRLSRNRKKSLSETPKQVKNVFLYK